MYLCGVRVCGMNVWGGWVRVCVCGFFCVVLSVCVWFLYLCVVCCECVGVLFVFVVGVCVCVLWVCVVWSVTCDVSRMW